MARGFLLGALRRARAELWALITTFLIFVERRLSNDIFQWWVMAFLAMLMGLALAGSAPQEPETATQVEDVVVQGGRIDDQVRRFIDEVAAPPTGRGPARWRDRICVGVANIRGEEADTFWESINDEGNVTIKPVVSIKVMAKGEKLYLDDERNNHHWVMTRSADGKGLNCSNCEALDFGGNDTVHWKYDPLGPYDLERLLKEQDSKE